MTLFINTWLDWTAYMCVMQYEYIGRLQYINNTSNIKGARSKRLEGWKRARERRRVAKARQVYDYCTFQTKGHSKCYKEITYKNIQRAFIRPYSKYTVYIIKIKKICFSPFDSSDEEDQVAIDFGAVDKFINVAGVHCLGCLQARCSYVITGYTHTHTHTHTLI